MRAVILITAFLSLFLVSYVYGIAVMSVDLGSEWFKVGIVSPGVPMEIALNKESKRKTPAVLSIRNNERNFGEDAQTVGIRFPKNAYIYLLDLLGKDINHPMVKLYQKRFPYYDIVEDKERGTILFKHDDDTFYSPEELIAQFLYKSKQFAENSANQPIKECVLTVPGYFNQIERKSLLQAAKLANLKVLQLMNDYTAVALNYGIFRTKDFNETAQYILFYDMGASSTTATIVSLQNVKTKERGYVETNPQISVIGVGFDRTLGGLEMQIRLRDHLAKKFNELKKTKTDVFKNPRAMSKLFKEAGRVKNILSANADHYAQIEGLLDEQDFRVQITREEFENLNKDLFERVGNPVKMALDAAGLSIDVINQFVLVGAGTRVPKVQEKLQEITKKPLAKNLNTDEAATMGAVYKAADLSKGFQVKKFVSKDAVLYPIQVTFEKTGGEFENTKKTVKRTLFNFMNPYPQKKIITFNKHTNDFNFNVNYAELDVLPMVERENIGSFNISQIFLEGVSTAINKFANDKVESKGIKAHFQMDESGILNLVNVELVVEKTVENNQEEEEGTLSKLGSTFTKLFSGQSDDKNEDVKPVKEEPELDANNNKEDPNNVNKTEGGKNGTEKDGGKDLKPKIVTLKEPIKSTETSQNLAEMSKDQFENSANKLKKLNDIEKEINRRASALNNLESFVIDVQNKLYENEYSIAGTPEELEKIKVSCSEVSDWLYEDGSDAAAEMYETKLATLKSLTKNLFMRVFEHKERPEALKALEGMLNGSRQFLESAQNLTKSSNPEKDVFTDVEIETLQKVIKETEEWRDKAVEEQNKLKPHETVKLTVKLLSEKMQLLDREVKYLVNKIKIWKPKKVEKPKEEEEATANKTKEEKASDKKEEVVLETPEQQTTTEKEKTAEKESKTDQNKSKTSEKDSKTENTKTDEHAEL